MTARYRSDDLSACLKFITPLYRLGIMITIQSPKEKWISDAAYYKSLARRTTPGLETQDWLEAEQEYEQLMKKRIKSGLININQTHPVKP
jgi:diphthamide biosynthesis methyltransferase